LSDSVLEMLINMNMSLEYFGIKIHPVPRASIPIGLDPMDINLVLLKRFIESQSSTLKSLEIFQVNELQMAISSPSFCPFPIHLPNLTLLEIHRPFVKNFAHLINNFPSLKEARFWFSKDTSWSAIVPNVLQKHGNLKTLRIEYIDAKSLTKLLQCFPNISTLQLAQCSSEVVQALGQFFVELKGSFLQEYIKICTHCLGSKIFHPPEQLSFWDQSCIQELSNSSTLPG